jgi:hypothetical protein
MNDCDSSPTEEKEEQEDEEEEEERWKDIFPNDFQAVDVEGDDTSEKASTCISPFVHPNVHVITCSSSMWPEMHASTEAFTWSLYVRTPLVTASHNLFPRLQKDALTSLLIHAN